MPGTSPGMTNFIEMPSMQTNIETPGASVPLEKIALETYVPPAKPSLIGLSRA
jgi:hypothetical protein